MTSTNPFFVRDNLGQQPGQQGTSWSSCPDLILMGLQPAQDPTVFTTPTGYATDYGSTVYAQNPPVQNFVYLRALNTGAASPQAPVTGRAWFYWVESDLALWPMNWNATLITVAGNPANYQDLSATSNNQVVIPNLPFLWGPPPPVSGQHYCVISWIESPPSQQPQNPVLSIGTLGTFDALVNFVLSNPNMGWRNTADVSAQLTWSYSTNITGPTQPGAFWVGVQCTNMPTDGQIGFSIPGPNPSIPPIISNMGPITNPNMYNSVMINNWPGNSQSSITVDYKQGATAPPKGANVIVTLMVPKPGMSEETFARAVEHGRVFDIQREWLIEFQRDLYCEFGESITVCVIGSQSYNF